VIMSIRQTSTPQVPCIIMLLSCSMPNITAIDFMLCVDHYLLEGVAILLPDTNQQAAQQVAERLRIVLSNTIDIDIAILFHS